MIHAAFSISDGNPTGVRVTGHSGIAEFGQDIVCAAVSSAVMLAANTITEFTDSRASVTDGGNEVIISGCTDGESQLILNGLMLHLTTLSDIYRNAIKVTKNGGNDKCL